jgi:ketosteroid isomerase-like protein
MLTQATPQKEHFMSSNRVEEVLTTARELVAAFGRHDPDAYFPFFAQDASFVFYTHPDMLASRAEWEELWVTWEKDFGFRVHSCKSHDGVVEMVAEDVAVVRHRVVSDISFDGSRDILTERETIVFAYRDGNWLAVHEHLSPLEGGE